MTPTLAAQFHAPVLDVWAGPSAYRVGFVGGVVREIVAEFATLDEAMHAYRAARAAAPTTTQPA